MEKKQYTKPSITAYEVHFGTPLLAMSTPEYKTVLKYNVEGNIEQQEFNDSEFSADWGDSSTATDEQ